MVHPTFLHTHTHTHTFNRPFYRTTQVSRYQKGKTNLDFTEARDSEWQWHQLGHMQVCTSLQTDNHTSTSPHFVRDYPGRPVPEETFTHSHPFWSSDIIYQLLPSTTIYSILPIQFTCLTVLFHNLSPGPLWSSSWSGPPYFILHAFLHPIIIFLQHMPTPWLKMTILWNSVLHLPTILHTWLSNQLILKLSSMNRLLDQYIKHNEAETALITRYQLQFRVNVWPVPNLCRVKFPIDDEVTIVCNDWTLCNMHSSLINGKFNFTN